MIRKYMSVSSASLSWQIPGIDVLECFRFYQALVGCYRCSLTGKLEFTGCAVQSTFAQQPTVHCPGQLTILMQWSKSYI